MLSSDTIRAELDVLKASRCYAPDAKPAQCPHRTEADGAEGTGACARCRLACDHVMAMIVDRVWSVASEHCRRACREDIAGDVTAEFVERLVSGRLLRSWTPGKPVLAIASRDFIYKRIVSAARAWKRQHGNAIPLDVIDVQVEYADHSDDSEGIEVAERHLRASLRPETWTGRCIEEQTAALQLFPMFDDVLRTNVKLMDRLHRSLVGLSPSEDPAALIDMWHRRKAQEQGLRLAALGDQARRSRTHLRFSQIQEDMEQQRLTSWLTPLDAADLMVIMGLTRANADKRIQRYRDFLAHSLNLPQKAAGACAAMRGLSRIPAITTSPQS